MSLDRNVSSTTIHQEHQTTTDDSQDFKYLLSLAMALAPIVTMDFTLSFSGTHSLGTCSGEPGDDAADQMPVSLDPDLREMLHHVDLLKPQVHKLLDLKLCRNAPVEAIGLFVQEVAELRKASRAETVASHRLLYLTSSLGQRLEITRRKDGRGRPVTPPSSGGGDILNLFSLNQVLPGPGTACRHRRPVILKLDQTGAGRHSALESRIGQFLAASFWHSQTSKLRAFCQGSYPAEKMKEEESTPKVVRANREKCSFKSARVSRR